MKINGKIVPHKYIAEYNSTPSRIQDLDSYVDSNGLLHRNVLEHMRSTIVFKTPPLYMQDKIALQSLIPSRIKVSVEYWNDIDNSYTMGYFYIPDTQFDILLIEGNKMIYSPITFELIEY